jgi:hypothetical protein
MTAAVSCPCVGDLATKRARAVASVTDRTLADPRRRWRRTGPMLALRSRGAAAQEWPDATRDEPRRPLASLWAMKPEASGAAREDEPQKRFDRVGAVTFASHSIDGTMPSRVHSRVHRIATPQSRHGASAMERARSHHASLGDARRGRELMMVYARLASHARVVIPRNREDRKPSRTCASSTTRYTKGLDVPAGGTLDLAIAGGCSLAGWTRRNGAGGRLCLIPQLGRRGTSPRSRSPRNPRVKDLSRRHMTQQIHPVRRQLPDGLADAAPPPSSHAIARNGSAPCVLCGGAIPTTRSATRRNASRLAGVVGRESFSRPFGTEGRIARRRRSPRANGRARLVI